MLIIVSACKTVKVSPIASALDKKDLLEKIDKNRKPFLWMDGKARVSLMSNKYNQKFNAVIRIKEDSVIWAVGRELSVEGGRMLMRPDSIFIINRIARTYLTDEIHRFLQYYGISESFDNVQNIVIGRSHLPLSGLDVEKKMINKTQLECKIIEGPKQYIYTIDTQSQNLSISEITNFENRLRMEMTYANHKTIESEVLIPFYCTFKVFKAGVSVLELKIEYSNVTVGTEKSIKFSIPTRYKQI